MLVPDIVVYASQKTDAIIRFPCTKVFSKTHTLASVALSLHIFVYIIQAAYIYISAIQVTLVAESGLK